MSTSTEMKKAVANGDLDKFQEIVSRRMQHRMSQIDNLPSDVRACVHEYGWTVVRALLDVGVKKPKQIRHIVETVLNEFSPTRGSYSAQGRRGDGYGAGKRSQK